MHYKLLNINDPFHTRAIQHSLKHTLVNAGILFTIKEHVLNIFRWDFKS